MSSDAPRRLAAPLLLVAVACGQIALAYTSGLSPWLGGGFGMFATIDARSERHVVVWVDAPGLTRELRVPDALLDAERQLRVFPTRARLEAFASGLLARERARIPAVERVRVELWRVEREPGTLAPRPVLVREVAAGRGA